MPKTIIELPHVGESVTEGVISRWLVQPGQKVRKYDPLVEVMTDKVNMEVPSPFSGTLTRTLVEEGETVPMGQAIAEMDVEGEAVLDALSAATAPATPVTSAPAAPGSSAAAQAPSKPAAFEFVDSVRSVGPTGSGEGGQGRPDALQEAANKTKTSQTQQRLSPLVKRLVGLHDIDLSSIKGTGLGGRITKDDVLALVERRKAGDTRDQAPIAASGASRLAAGVQALTPLRKTIAEHMTRSAREIPAAWTMVEVDVTGLVRFRESKKAAFQHANGFSLTYLPLTAYVVTQALTANPMINGRWTDAGIVLNERVNLGIAVSTDQGLFVPVVHGAEQLGVRDLAAQANAVVMAARNGKLKLDDVQGGTFTLNNTGALGSVVSQPIINHPQAAIVTTEAIVKRPVVIHGDAIAVRSTMNVCMTFDHRVCDGADASRFLADIKASLEAIDESSNLL